MNMLWTRIIYIYIHVAERQREFITTLVCSVVYEFHMGDNVFQTLGSKFTNFYFPHMGDQQGRLP